MKRLISVALCAFFFALIFSAHHVYAQAPRKVKLTIAVDAHTSSPVYLAKARGYFADEGLDVQVISTGGGGPDIMAVIAGEAEFTFSSGASVILAYQEGKRLIMVSTGLNRVTMNWAMHKDAAKAKGITESSPLGERLKALKGLTVGVTRPGALTAHLANFVIRKAGYEPQKDVNILAVGFGPGMIAALENRKVDVAVSSPEPEISISRGFAIMLLNHAKESSLIPEFLQQNLTTRPEVVEKDPELVRKMVRALVKANKWALSSSPEQVAEAIKPFLGKMEPAILLDGVKSHLPAFSPDGRTSERSVQITQDILEQGGVLKKRVAFSEIVTNDFLPK